MNNKHWLLDAIDEMEKYAEQNKLQGLVEGLSGVLEVYAAEAMTSREQQNEIISRIQK